MSTTTSLPPWDQLTFVFGLYVNDTAITDVIPQCTNATWQYWEEVDGKIANPRPTPPYRAVIYAGGYQPYMIPLNNTVATGSTNWTANLPTGPIRYGISMMDSKNYTGGILERPFVATPGRAGCNVANPLKPSTLDVEVSGTNQCEQAVIDVKNGTGPYKLEVVRMNEQQKTIYYASSPFGVILDMSAGVEYYLAVYDSVGNSAVMGSYNISATSDNTCLGDAKTVTAGMFSTLYPGGTATAISNSTVSSNGLATPAIIGIAVGVPIAAIILTALLLWFCYERNRRQRELEDKPEIDPGVSYPHSMYTPVPTTATHYTGSFHDAGSTGYYNAPVAAAYSIPYTSSDRNTIRTDADASASEPSSTGFSEKRRHLVNSDAHNLSPIIAEPFDPSSISGTSGSRPGLPPLPPAYSAAS
ncbi:hypothetical protein RSOLAG22IIIB_00420 [Rhizoctonia solani]|uniref:Uncharacterized protein n=1 Tax=Rhizoctonia solani TaxID=456999 RepID=A0A0K6FVC6_9AGAM|nr:hypothetical protein RSOLAG22IIIB_00420 [Rhizoctonia solani]